jgi:O-methyltransferase
MVERVFFSSVGKVMMFGVVKNACARVLPPPALFWLRSVKRAVMSQAPLQRPGSASNPTDHGFDLSLPLQSIALERYHLGLFPVPENMFNLEATFYLSLREVIRALTLCVDYINTADIKGDIAEFGTMSGSTARAIATAMVFDPVRQKGHPPLRRLRLFDSFEGLPEITSSVDQTSPHVISGNWAQGGCKVLSSAELDTAIARILPRERFDITPGWFADTVKQLPPETRFAMVHFDGDLYQSTIDALMPCFEKGFIRKARQYVLTTGIAIRPIPRSGKGVRGRS